MSDEKNGIRISLTEPVVFLRGADTAHRHRRTQDEDPVSEGAPLRGLLTMTLTKPTRIRTIEVELQCKTSTTWPEGMGARRIDVVEDHTVFTAHAVYFDACTDPQITTNPRRGLSTGPGIQLDADHIPPRRGRSSRPVSPSGPGPRHASTDRTNFQRAAPALTYHEPVPPTPPYTPSAEPSTAWPQSPTILPTTLSGYTTPINSDETRDRHPLHILEHSRHVLLGHLEQAHIDPPPSVRRRSMTPANMPGVTSPTIQSSASSVRSAGPSRRESSDEDGPPPLSPPPSSSSPNSSSRHIPTLATVRGSTSVTPSSSKARIQTPSADTERGGRGGSGSRTRFSIASVVDVFRHKSRRTHSPDSMAIDECDSPSCSRERSRVEGERGRPRQKTTFITPDEQEDHIEEADHHKHDKQDHHRQNWKEFRKGTYTYPILFTLPRTCPASLHATHGSVQWRLRATAHRPGAFNPALRAEKPVQVVAAPGEADTEESESIVVERAWDDQLQYILSVSGRAFPIGGNIPLQIVFMPLDKVKVHRVVVYMDEKLEYMTAMSRVVRADPLRRHLLLSLRGPDEGIPLLPLPSGDFDLGSSTLAPLFPLSTKLSSELTDADHEALSETVASLSGPGPWSLDMNIPLPNCDPHSALGPLRPSNKNKRANVLVTHSLRVLMRVERGDDKAVDAKGKRKMFDIVVCSPVHLFSCLCSPESAVLPRYGADPRDVGPRTVADGSLCGCAIISAASAGPSSSTRPTMPPRRISGSNGRASPGIGDSQAWRHERLVAGQEAESGERPPEYVEVVSGRA